MPELHVSFSIHSLLLCAAFLGSCAGAWIVYRSTVPPVSTLQRIILIVLRSSGLFLIILILGEPILSFVSHSTVQPGIAVLMDNSRSMTIKDKSGKRDELYTSILHSPVWQQVRTEGQLDYILFDGKVRRVQSFSPDSLLLNGDATDIAQAFRALKHTDGSANLQAVLLLTDGNSTIGMNPLYDAEDLGVPVFSIGIGDTSEQKDLVLRKILTNEIAYAGSQVPVNVLMHSYGFGGETVRVTLRHGTALLQEKTVVLNSGSQDYQIPLTLTLEQEGIQRYTVDISPLPGELTTQNNRTHFFIKVLKSKISVILIAGSPSQDAACIGNILKKDKNIELHTFIERSDGSFYNGELTEDSLTRTECIMLIGYPSPRSTQRHLQMILGAAKKQTPVFILLSRAMDYNKLQILGPILPFSIEQIQNQERQIFAAVSDGRRDIPLLHMKNETNTASLWRQLPPVFQVPGLYRSKIESEVLATAQAQSALREDPFILQRNINNKKSVSVLGYGIWRWKMMSSPGSETEQVLEQFLENSIRWLTTTEDTRKSIVQPVKRIFSLQDPIEFTGQVYDESFQPIDDAQVEVRVQDGKEILSLVLSPIENGQYQGSYDRFHEGEFTYTASVQRSGGEIGTDRGAFTVGGLNAEFLETRMNTHLLQQISAQTGGQYYAASGISQLPEDVARLARLKPQENKTITEHELWNSRIMLILVLTLFACEWLLRKWYGML